MAQRRIIVEEAMVFEGSESSDEEFINVPQSEPLEPALQESVLLDDPQLAPLRLQRMLMQLQHYDGDVKYKKGKELFRVDALSWAYLPNFGMPLEGPSEVSVVKELTPINSEKFEEFKGETAKDPNLALEELETTTLEELDAFQQGPPLQAPEPPQQAQQAPEPQKAEEPAPKRSRGRPRKVQAVCQPPPERPQTPPPQQTKAQQDTCKQRSLDRRQQVLRILKKREITANEVQGMRSLMVEDEEDRHGCLGAWIWNDFKAENAYINEEITFTGEGGGMSEAAQRARTELDCFRLFFTTAVIDNLVKQTNLYAQQIGARESYLGWTPVGREDILAFMGVAMAMSVSHKGDVNEYWTTEEILEQPWFSSVMSVYHWLDVNLKMRILGLGKATEVAPLSHEAAVELGAEMIGETFIFTVAVGCLAFEYWRQARKEEKHENKQTEAIERLENRVNELGLILEQQDAKLREMNRFILNQGPTKTKS
ncbi:Optic atrophy 3 protein-like [Holothuria leucospilota]|uniref:Optic atrophy 3 protein-like n=1 Tax=Holothuria leucospilota TaxID=206669 RepID=A0A9Q1HH34_HOLLE|nr:Optic atrophy 3 protein-like [Holothuria leucospilota]